jgi:hypothetical protein
MIPVRLGRKWTVRTSHITASVPYIDMYVALNRRKALSEAVHVKLSTDLSHNATVLILSMLALFQP